MSTFTLDYREEYDDTHRWTDRIISSSGDWSGNVFDFFYRVYNRLQLNIKVPFTMDGPYRVDDTCLLMQDDFKASLQYFGIEW